jgi:hypothetical protein
MVAVSESCIIGTPGDITVSSNGDEHTEFEIIWHFTVSPAENILDIVILSSPGNATESIYH